MIAVREFDSHRLHNMKKKIVDQIDTNLEQIIENLVEAGKRNTGKQYEGDLPPQEWESLKLAQNTLSILRSNRTTKK